MEYFFVHQLFKKKQKKVVQNASPFIGGRRALKIRGKSLDYLQINKKGGGGVDSAKHLWDAGTDTPWGKKKKKTVVDSGTSD